jgi:hypothetical protein
LGVLAYFSSLAKLLNRRLNAAGAAGTRTKDHG